MTILTKSEKANVLQHARKYALGSLCLRVGDTIRISECERAYLAGFRYAVKEHQLKKK